MRSHVIITIALMFGLLWAADSIAQPVAPVSNEHTTAELVTGPEALTAGNPLWVGVRFSLKPRWHLYWENPGDSGIPTTFAWQLPEGFTAGPIHWPPPARIPYAGLFNYGYGDQVTLLAPITPPQDLPAGTHTLTLKADWLVCDDICVPETANFTFQLSTEVAHSNALDAATLERIVNTMPQPFKGAATYAVTESVALSFAPEEEVTLDQVTNAWWYPIDDGIITNDGDQILSAKHGVITLQAVRGAQKPKAEFKGMLALTDASGDKQFYIATATLTGKPPAANSPLAMQPLNFESDLPDISDLGLWSALLLAFVGGLILNIMPCVLPVLSLKALSISKKASAGAAAVRKQGMAYTLGVLISFAAVAGLLLILKETGQQIGWGFQLQSPAFVTGLIYTLFLVGLNLSGVFELPSSYAGLGSGKTQGDSLSASFFTGALATLVATPCTAPFMATALGYALGQNSFVAMMIFLSLGFGLAFPLLLICFVPPLYRLLPKPGLWMMRFKQLLAFPMYASVAWLVWVLSQQVGAFGLAYALAGLCLIGFAAWSLPLVRGVLYWLILLATLALTTITLQRQSGIDTQSASKSIPSMGEAFSPELLQQYRENGVPVFVDATAAWCLTCKVNERVALNDEGVKQAFKDQGIKLLVADWTNRDESITQYLASFNRNGVPLYVYYPPLKNPIILPQILTPSIVRKAIQP